jgi:ribosomal protein L20A (L18A)
MEMRRRSLGIVIAILAVAIILICAWAPWLTEEYGKEKVLNYFNQKYSMDKDDIRISSVEKKSFEFSFQLYLSPSNKSLPETSVRAWVTFYGEVKHEILSAPWFTEENAKEKIFSYFSQKYSVNKNDIRISSVEKKPFEIDFGISFPLPRELYESCVTHAWVTVYGEAMHEPTKCG